MHPLHSMHCPTEATDRRAQRPPRLSMARGRNSLYDGIMTVNVLLFASAADAYGSRSIALELPPGATVAELRRQLAAIPGGDRVPARSMIARNRVYARDDEPVGAGDELALIPPVAGG